MASFSGSVPWVLTASGLVCAWIVASAACGLPRGGLQPDDVGTGATSTVAGSGPTSTGGTGGAVASGGEAGAGAAAAAGGVGAAGGTGGAGASGGTGGVGASGGAGGVIASGGTGGAGAVGAAGGAGQGGAESGGGGQSTVFSCDVTGCSAADPVNCYCSGCNTNGYCGYYEDCICPDCASTYGCAGVCDEDGACHPYYETCDCTDCAGHSAC